MKDQNQKFTKYSDSFAVVTGASSGIGFELAKVFAQNGFDLLIAAEDEEIHSAAKMLKVLGNKVEVMQTDLSTYAGVEELCYRIKNMPGTLDSIAINAEGGLSGEFLETSLEDELNMIQLNIVSSVHIAKRVLPILVGRRQGRILFTSSITSDLPGPYYAVYASARSFIQTFAEAIRNELKDTGVTITVLKPGSSATNFFERAKMLDTKLGASPKDDPVKLAKEGFLALMEGKDHVIAGSLKNVFQNTIAKIIPENQATKTNDRQPKSDSANQ